MKEYVKLLEGKRLKSGARGAVQFGFVRTHFAPLRASIGSEVSRRAEQGDRPRAEL